MLLGGLTSDPGRSGEKCCLTVTDGTVSLGMGWVSWMLVASVMGRHEVENEGVLALPFILLKDGKDVDRSISLERSLNARFATDDSISLLLSSS